MFLIEAMEDVDRKLTKKKAKEMRMRKTRSVGAELDHLEAERNIVTDPDDNRYRRTLLLVKRDNSWGFTLATYGIKHKQRNEIDIVTYVDYVELNGAADIAGMRRGDVIVSVNGRSVENFTHQELVASIKASSDNLRLVVLFEDCCRKVELQYRILQLKKILSTKIKELRDVEAEEQAFVNDVCDKRGLSRFDVLRQSIISTVSGTSWDQFSLLTANQVSKITRDNAAHERFVRQSLCESIDGSSILSDSLDDSYPDLSYIDTGSSVGACSAEDFHSEHESVETGSDFGIVLGGGVTNSGLTLRPLQVNLDPNYLGDPNGASSPKHNPKQNVLGVKRVVKDSKNDCIEMCAGGGKNRNKFGKMSGNLTRKDNSRKTSSSSLPDITLSQEISKPYAFRKQELPNGRFRSMKKISTVSEPEFYLTRINVNERFPLKSFGTKPGLKLYASSEEIAIDNCTRNDNSCNTIIPINRSMSQEQNEVSNLNYNRFSLPCDLIASQTSDVLEQNFHLNKNKNITNETVSNNFIRPLLTIPKINVTHASDDDMSPTTRFEETDHLTTCKEDSAVSSNYCQSDLNRDVSKDKPCQSDSESDITLEDSQAFENIHMFDSKNTYHFNSKILSNHVSLNLMSVIQFYTETDVYINEKDEETKL